MKKETVAAKLAALYGLTDVDTSVYADKPKNKKLTPGQQAVQEEEIQNFRAAQGVMYFLQAPELFTLKKCKHCQLEFLVSRKQVSCCSYTCIRLELEKLGIEWSRHGQYEELAKDPSVYEGNEPLWIRNVDFIRQLIN